MEENFEFLLERYELAVERIAQIKEEHTLEGVWNDYFVAVASFLEKLDRYYDFVRQGRLETADFESLQVWNKCLYEDLLEEKFETCYGNTAYAEKLLGEEYGRLLSAVVAEMYSLIMIATENRLEEVLIRLELFIELYSACVCEWQESARLPEYETLKQIVYWYVSDYTDITMERQFREKMASQTDVGVEYSVRRMTELVQGVKIHPVLCVPIKGILQDDDWLRESFLWDKALAKRRREVAETLQEKYFKE